MKSDNLIKEKVEEIMNQFDRQFPIEIKGGFWRSQSQKNRMGRFIHFALSEALLDRQELLQKIEGKRHSLINEHKDSDPNDANCKLCSRIESIDWVLELIKEK